MNFGTLKSRILAVIGRAPADVCYELVTADINQQLRLSCMEATTTLTEAATVSLPSDFLQVVSVYRDTDPRYPLRPTTDQNVHRTYDTSGIPREYSIVDESGTKTMVLNPSPSGSEDIVLRYYAKLSDLSADSDENDILTLYPSIYVYGALTHHSMLIRDMQGAQGWALAYEKAKKQAKQEDVGTRFGGTPLTPRAIATA
jgi:hypothetical protein